MHKKFAASSGLAIREGIELLSWPGTSMTASHLGWFFFLKTIYKEKKVFSPTPLLLHLHSTPIYAAEMNCTDPANGNEPSKTNLSLSQWVFKIKRDSTGNVSRYKAPPVAKGFKQQYGIDYEETFAPTLNLSSVRLLLTLATHFDYETAHLDVKTAFLNGICPELIDLHAAPKGTKSRDTTKVWTSASMD
jgi:hypothetical protein